MRRSLGRSDLKVSPLGLGTVKIGRNQDVKYPQAFTIPGDNEVCTLLDVAHELGINLIDTAPAYGNSEARLGKLLTARHEWIICTKVGEYYPHGYDFSAGRTTASIEASLKHLRTDYLDVVLIHSDGNDLDAMAAGAGEALLKARDAGKVRAIGASTKTIAGGLEALATLDIVMVEYNSDNHSQLPVIEAAARTGRGVLIKKALASGHAIDPGESIKDVAGVPGVSSVIVGTINPGHLAANVAAIVA